MGHICNILLCSTPFCGADIVIVQDFTSAVQLFKEVADGPQNIQVCRFFKDGKIQRLFAVGTDS